MRKYCVHCWRLPSVVKRIVMMAARAQERIAGRSGNGSEIRCKESMHRAYNLKSSRPSPEMLQHLVRGSQIVCKCAISNNYTPDSINTCMCVCVVTKARFMPWTMCAAAHNKGISRRFSLGLVLFCFVLFCYVGLFCLLHSTFSPRSTPSCPFRMVIVNR